MIRIVLLQLLLFATPFVVWLVYSLLVRRKGAGLGPDGGKAFDDAPTAWLIVSGILLSVLCLAGLALFSGAPTSGKYVPPQYVDGEIVPGHVE